MTPASAAKKTGPVDDPLDDPRLFKRIPAARLIVDQRKQREVDPEKVARIANEFDWSRFEALTVVPAKLDGNFDVVEGQHRTLALQQLSSTVCAPCMVLAAETSDKRQSEVAYQIVKGRRVHSAFETWRLRYNAGHEHEIFATSVMDDAGVRLGKAQSAMTIAAAATVSYIVHSNGASPEAGAATLKQVLHVLMTAFPTYDGESNVTRWNRYMLLAVARIFWRMPDVDQERLVKALRVRPAGQWVNLGKGAEKAQTDEVIVSAVAAEYNRGKRLGRIA